MTRVHNPIRRILSALSALILLSMLLLSAMPARAGAYPVAVIDNPKAPHQVHLRKGKGTSTESLGLYYSGVQVEVHDAQGDWWKVNIGNREGYIQASFLIPCGDQSAIDEAAAARAYQAIPQATVDNPDPADRLHLRDRPSSSGNSYGRFYNGTVVEIWGTTEEWSHVLAQGASGFMLTKHLKQIDGTQTVSFPNPGLSIVGYAVVNNPEVEQQLHLRSEPRESSPSHGQYYNGTTVELLEQSGEWWSVRVFDRLGYMHADYLRPDSSVSRPIAVDTGLLIGEEGMGALPLRSYPSDSAPITPVYFDPGQTTADILGQAGIWYHIRVDGQEGYIHTQWILPGIKAATPNLFGVWGVVASPNGRDRLHLRDKPSTSGNSLGQFFNGTQVELLEGGQSISMTNWQNASGWYKVRVNGQVGYMMAKYIAPMYTGAP